MLPDKLSNLSIYKNNEEIIRLAAAQVEKDFASNGIDISFSGNTATAYDELFVQVKPVVKNMLENNRNKFSQLLYTIDLSEKKANEIFADNSFADAVEKITQFILERELLKVITRKHFSK
jgi:hypothetical protein